MFVGNSLLTAVPLALLVALAVDSTAAKRGCSAFGHSCFGGHGKRMDSAMGSAPEDVLYGGSNAALPPGAYMPDPQLVFTEPRAGGPVLQDRDQDQQLPLRELHLSPFLRHWLQSYRASLDSRQDNM